MFVFPGFSLLIKCHCCVNAVNRLLEISDCDCGQTTYAVMIVTFLFFLPNMVVSVHLPIPEGSFVVVQCVDKGCDIADITPPGWYGFPKVIEDDAVSTLGFLKCLLKI